MTVDSITVHQFKLDGRAFGAPFRLTREEACRDAVEAGYGVAIVGGFKFDDAVEIVSVKVKPGALSVEKVVRYDDRTTIGNGRPW